MAAVKEKWVSTDEIMPYLELMTLELYTIQYGGFHH